MPGVFPAKYLPIAILAFAFWTGLKKQQEETESCKLDFALKYDGKFPNAPIPLS